MRCSPTSDESLGRRDLQLVAHVHARSVHLLATRRVRASSRTLVFHAQREHDEACKEHRPELMTVIDGNLNALPQN